MNIAARSVQGARDDLIADEVSVLEKTATVGAGEQMLIQKIRLGWRKLAGGSKNA
jgi:hypothetical protein